MSKIVGNYELTLKLGSGSYAQVYRCIHSRSGEPYAIKAISKEKVGDPKLMENLEQEISIMRDYLHPNIVQLFEHFSSSRYIYLVLELCPGGDLSKFIKRYHRIEEFIAQGFLRQLSDGLHFLQEKNVIHRDLKPANVLLSEFSNQAVLKIADFGFAKHLVEASMAQTPCGSPLYMAPEIFEMQEYDAKADIWSVGCVFYEMLVGAPPFKGSNPRELFQNIRTKPLQIPSDVVVGPQSVALLKKMLERNPRRRASMDQFCAACTSLPITHTAAHTVQSAQTGHTGGMNSGMGNRNDNRSASNASQSNVDMNNGNSGNTGNGGNNTGNNAGNMGDAGGNTEGVKIPNTSNNSNNSNPPAPGDSANNMMNMYVKVGDGGDSQRQQQSGVNEGHRQGGYDGDTSTQHSQSERTHQQQSQQSQQQSQYTDQQQLSQQQQQQQQSQQSQQGHGQQTQQQQNNTRFTDPLGEPLSRRHSVDSGPTSTVNYFNEQSNNNNSNNINNRSGYNDGMGGNDRGSERSERNNDRNSERNNERSNIGDMDMNQGGGMLSKNTSVNSSSYKQHPSSAQKPSMASSLLVEGISRMMDFLSKSPSQKSPPQQSSLNPLNPHFNNGPGGPGGPGGVGSGGMGSNTQYPPAPFGAPGGQGNQGSNEQMKRNRAQSYSDTDSRSRPTQFNHTAPNESAKLSRNSSTIQAQTGLNRANSLTQKGHSGGYYQNLISNEDQRRERMSAVTEEKEISKGMRLSGSDDGFVLVEPTPPPAPPHPWRSGSAGYTAPSISPSFLMKNYPTSSSGKTSAATSTATATVIAAQGWGDNAIRDQYESNSQKYQQQQQQQQQQYQGGQGHGQQTQQLLQHGQQTQHTQNEYPLQQSPSQPSQLNQQLYTLKEHSNSFKEHTNRSSIHESEKILLSNLTERAEYVCQVVLSIVTVGDLMARETLLVEKKKEVAFAGVGASMSGIKGLKGTGRPFRPRGDSSDGPMATLSGACALYLHCVALLKDMLMRISPVISSRRGHQAYSPENNMPPNTSPQMTLEGLQQGLLLLFDQLLSRVEHCYKRLVTLSSSSSKSLTAINKHVYSASPTQHSPQWGYLNSVPGIQGPVGASTIVSPGRITAEPLMYRAALQLARDASVEELLGNLQSACDSYTSARLLMEGILMTACEPGDRDTLQHFIVTFTDQLNNCKQLQESHIMILPTVQRGSMNKSNVATAISHSPGSLQYCQSSQSSQHYDSNTNNTNTYYNQLNQLNQNNMNNQLNMTNQNNINNINN